MYNKLKVRHILDSNVTASRSAFSGNRHISVACNVDGQCVSLTFDPQKYANSCFR